MSIEDVLGRPPALTDGTFGPGPLDHGPDEWCAGRPFIAEGEEPLVEATQEVEIEGEGLVRMLCHACGKTWYERKDG